MTDAPDILEQTGTAWLRIDRASGRVVECSALALSLLDTPAGGLQGQPWSDCLGAPDGGGLLEQALSTGLRTPLAPFIHPRETDEILLTGMTLPAGESASLLLLWPLLCTDGAGFPELDSNDVVAVLGVESADRVAPVAPAVMENIHDSLFGILRSSDFISRPVGSSIALLLKDAELPVAQDINRALLSHLRGWAASREALPDLRLAVGMAKPVEGDSPLAALLAANRALLCLRQGGQAESIRGAGQADVARVARAAAEPFALFSSPLELQFEQVQDVATAVAEEMRHAGTPMERGIDGYVDDNMEGAVDQAIFLAGLDIPIAIIGPQGTGKLYIARVVQQNSQSGGGDLVVLDCREFRGRRDATERIASALLGSQDKTLVFKSPHLMSSEVQLKLARQVSSRTLSDASSRRAMPRNQLVALFPEELERLVAQGKLVAQLASVFAGYPIRVPPIRDRKQAVLRWAHKILAQEGELRRRELKGFTRDAEQAMQQHDWPGNITDMRQCIVDALDRTDKAWITPVDLGLYKGLDVQGTRGRGDAEPFLKLDQKGSAAAEDHYVPSTVEAVDQALGEVVNNLVVGGAVQPLGIWAEDELVLAALDRYRDNAAKAAQLLHTRSRNIGRWLPKIHDRDAQRNDYPLWQECRRVLREWVREMPLADDSPLESVQRMLLAHVRRQSGDIGVAERAVMLGVSVPTYHKRLREVEAETQSGGEANGESIS